MDIRKLSHFMLFAVLSGFLIIVGKPFFIPIVFAFLLALLLNPIHSWIGGLVKIDWLSIILAFVVVTIPVLVSFFLFGLQLKGALDDFSLITERLGEFVNETFRWVNSKFQFSRKEGMDFITEKVTNSIDQPIEVFASGLSESTGFFANLLLTFLFAFFFLLYKRGLKNFILQQTSSGKKDTIQKMVRGIQEVTQHYLYGLLMVIVIVGLMNSIGLLIIGIDYAFFWGFFASFLAIIPYVGTAIGGFLPFVYALATADNSWQPLAVLGLFITVQAVEGNLITPKIVGNSVEVNPFAAILALLLGQLIWGIAGMVLALPVLAIIKVILDHVEGTQPFGFLVGDKLADEPDTLLEKWDDDKYKISSHLSKK